MAAPTKSSATFGQLPDLSGLSEAERLQVIAVMERAKDFERQEETKNASSTQQSRKPTEGQLLKYTNVIHGWQHRYFVLDPESGMLEYFEKEEHKKLRPRGSVHLAAAVVCPSDEDGQTFTVNAANGEIFRLRALDARGRQHWVDRLRVTAEYHTANIAQKKKKIPGVLQHAPPVSRRDSTGLPISTPPPKENLLVRRLDSSLGKKPLADVEENLPTKMTIRSQHKSVQAQQQDSFKEVKEYISEADDYSRHLANKITSLPYTSGYLTGIDRDLLLLKATSSATIQCLEQCLSILQSRQHGEFSSPSTPQPMDRKPVPVEVNRSSGQLIVPSPAESFTSASSLPYTFTDQKVEGPVNHDEEVEDKEEYRDSELGAVEEHKSIILHLLSQLKLGMDLTKVVLPTFILEKRSLLEMFADCMAHPDVFLRIPELDDPQERMLAVVEWYLTSFHAGRQGSVAKKPYNPIIGETFHCSWRIPNTDISSDGDEGTDVDRVSDVPSATTELVYCAEQVSHHPPVSAFYFECPQKQMYMNASIWTKSKFMGMSIGVVMVGKLHLHLLTHGEEYVFSLPSAYARSILTVPWVELGDKITISCEKTGYSASVVFHTKPFYGGKLHRVSAEVKDNATGTVSCKVQGEWNSKMEFSYTEGDPKSVDVQQLKIWRKRVRPIASQGEFESRRLWQHVTNALSVGDVTTATEHKRFLEDRQREGEKHRKETNTKFPSKFFHQSGDSWVYNNILKQGQTTGTA